MNKFTWIAIGLTVTGIVLLGRVARYFYWVAVGEHIVGVVAKHYVHRTHGGPRRNSKVMYSADIAYEFAGQEFQIELQARTGGVLSNYQAGQSVTVVVDARCPNRGLVFSGLEIVKWSVLAFGALVMLGLGSIILLVQLGVIQAHPV